jgi:LacI family transcriptional regulator
MPDSLTDAPTLMTVARLANVSVASASRVLNGIRTNPDTLERVLEAAEAVGYAPNAAARSLRSRRTGQIAFAMPNVSNPVYTTMVSSIQAVARTGGVRLLLHSTDADTADELALLRDLKQRYVDGLILCSLHFTDAHVAALRRVAVPVAVIGRPPKEARVDTVRPNSRRGAVEAVRHLHELGRRRIAFINGPEATTPGRARRLGYLDGLRACGLERDDNLIEVAEDFNAVEPGAEATARLLERTRPDALFCANDLLALGAVNVLRAAGLDVPRDVAVVGMDDSSAAALSWPPLTSVDLGSAERGRLAAELLLKRIEHPNRRPRTLVVEPRLVVRASSGGVA